MAKNAALQRNKTWLLKVENLSVVRECRKHISEEFGEKLHLTSDDLLERIQDYANRSEDPVLRRLARPIAHQLLENKAVDDQQQFDLANIPVITPAKISRSGWIKSSR